MGKLSDYKVKDKLNSGIKVPIIGFDNEDTGDWVVVASVYSNTFRKAKAESNRRILEKKQGLDDAEIIALEQEETAILHASLISDWSLDDALTIENAVILLDEYPPIRDKVVEVGIDTRLHVEKKLKPLKPSRRKSSRTRK